MSNELKKPGRLLRAPENFIDVSLSQAITRGGLNEERRDFLRKSFVAASALVAGGAALTQGARAATFVGDPNILNHTDYDQALGLPVASNPYGVPSKYETNLLRRESPGLTQVGGASVSFAPLQGLFGIITPSGLHFERHHQGWHDMDPSKHRLMVMGMVKNIAEQVKHDGR